MFGSILGTWLPLALILLFTWVTSEIFGMLPPTKLAAQHASHGR